MKTAEWACSWRGHVEAGAAAAGPDDQRRRHLGTVATAMVFPNSRLIELGARPQHGGDVPRLSPQGHLYDGHRPRQAGGMHIHGDTLAKSVDF